MRGWPRSLANLRENIAARRARVRLYQELLGGEDRLELIAHRSGSACLTQVVRVLLKGRGQDRASSLVEALGAAGYEVQGSYVPIHLLGNFNQCVWDRLPRAERVWGDLIELPCVPRGFLSCDAVCHDVKGGLRLSSAPPKGVKFPQREMTRVRFLRRRSSHEF